MMRSLAALLLVALLGAGSAGHAPPPSERFTPTSRPAPFLIWRDAEGGVGVLSGDRPRPTLVAVWATRCAPCRVEMPQLDALARALDGEIDVAPIALDRSGAVAVRAFHERMGIETLPILSADARAVTEATGVNALPYALLIDADGHEIGRVIGAVDWSGAADWLRGAFNP